ncbi:MAG: AraC family transcriptional regulator [Paludibacter sp.]|nr:AraC family transcriptional regulator [Paludibacter sp.]MDD4429480.1 AraC family transcriptional regulator [Paludibacter sp.]
MYESETNNKTPNRSGNQYESAIYRHVRRCVLLFEDGTQKVISNEKRLGTMTINIIYYLGKENDFVESVLKNFNYIDNLEDLSKKCGFYSTKTFTRHFINNFKVTPKQWMLSIKKEAMLNYLINTDYPLKQIADFLGFSNLSHLSDFCLKKTGMRPEEIRKEIIY